FRITRADTGEMRWISCRTRFIRDETGELVRTLGAHRDVTRRRQAENEVRESEERFRLAAEAAGLGVMDHDQASGKLECSDRFRAILGLPSGGEPALDRVFACIDPEDAPEVFRQRAAFLEDESRERLEITCRIRRGSDRAERWVCGAAWKLRV